VPGKDRQRALARAKLERQMARRAAAARRRRQIQAGIGALVAVILVIGGVVLLVKTVGTSTSSTPAAAASAGASSGSCVYTKSGNAAKKVDGVPVSSPAAAANQTTTVKTNKGTIVFTLDAKAPCTTNSFTFLAAQKYFDNTPCHRLLNQGDYVLQCGDPSGSGSGGPGYSFADENLPTGQKIYPAGTVAMANSGANTNGSQFFLVYKDSPFDPSYAVFGHITRGLDVLEKIGAAGTANGQADGKPKNPVTIESVTTG
jgi:peptidyl-prolyl cis-trans isomerase B (cyclophilin B)